MTNKDQGQTHGAPGEDWDEPDRVWSIPEAGSSGYWRQVLRDPKAHGYSPAKAEKLTAFFTGKRQPLTVAEKAEEHRGWYDETMDADHWFSLADVDPAKAAMLLCRFNPNNDTLAAAELSTTDETGPRDLVKLRQRFEDLSRTAPRSRTLADWLGVARGLKLRHHSWIDIYVNAAGIQVAEALGGQTEAPAMLPPVAGPAPAGAAGLPPETPTASALKTPDAGARGAQTGSEFPLKKIALIKQYLNQWPTIKADLSSAHQNGLAKAAKAGPRDWIETAALAWARSKGKLNEPQQVDALNEVMQNFAGTRHRIRR